MRLLVLGVSALALCVSACNRQDDGEPMVETADDASIPAAGTAGTGATTAGAGTAGDSAAAPSDDMTVYDQSGVEEMSEPASASGVSEETRMNAQARAESTNLHPRTPGN
ncbi:MAG: hypothetical protein ACK4E3_04805 [Brevundimonas sp.]|uniref:hypothetical protein n=1 Tax=Brevundimonas sp. TaxID=1871086 RepID=UPI003918DD8C